jgi:hypothetical protein
VPTRLPEFVRGDGVDAVAEFVAFQMAAREPAAEALARLGWIGTFGLDHVPTAHHVGPQGLYCHQDGGWGVFYTISGPRNGACHVSVLGVFDTETDPFGSLVSEAQRRRVVLGL